MVCVMRVTGTLTKVVGLVLLRYLCRVCPLTFGLISIGMQLFPNRLNTSVKKVGFGCITSVVCVLGGRFSVVRFVVILSSVWLSLLQASALKWLLLCVIRTVIFLG